MIDFHCHLDLYPDPQLAAEDADRARIYVLSVTTTPKAWRKTAELAKPYSRIRTALGLHPEIAHERIGELALFEVLAPETRYFGEIGLDGSAEYRAFQEIQAKVFDFILRTAAKAGGRIMTIHSRNAASAVLTSLRQHPDAGVPILHWFSGSPSELDAASRQGCWFSVGPAMLRSKKGRELAARMPRDRVLTETDGPFAKDKSRPLQPADAWVAVDELATIWGVSGEAAQAQLATNLRRLTVAIPENIAP
ncbi:Qat anti-phage system TatD family nuclease QatD [Caulobacter sp. Root487D2Y]|uniref:Qat anti-phage system TatD family nuclease QatD n=1 Tax=Caulobacter sp. Root487D2Y TaxID=1736547 RepID=UPI0009EAE0FD